MPRYIDADEIEFKPVEVVFEGKSYTSSEFFAHKKAIDRIPTADVEPVRHGHWIPSPDGINPIRCSECNMPAPFATVANEFGDFEIFRYPSSYCHECGAKMDEEGTENE